MTVEEGEKIAGEIGYPIIVKAALGGGGKGMRVAQTPDEFQASFQTAQKEAADGIRRRNNVSGTFCRASASYRIPDSCR